MPAAPVDIRTHGDYGLVQSGRFIRIQSLITAFAMMPRSTSLVPPRNVNPGDCNNAPASIEESVP